ncbi:MAG: hypothetical protein KGM15_11310 [Pseudomonadota bacterium]|nr:hypothetical protein [Pseudomonadota bacterium]
MSTLTLLPLVRVTDGVQPNEDWQLSIAYYLDDGVTPINLSGLTFTLNVDTFATLTSAGGGIVVTGPSNNLLVITALAAANSIWPSGLYSMSLTASDGLFTRELFAYSTLAVGSPQVQRVALLVAPDPIPRSIASPLPAALATAFQALQPSAISAALTGLSSSQLVTLSQALFASLPVQTGTQAPVASGQAFINSSGYVVIAQ